MAKLAVLTLIAVIASETAHGAVVPEMKAPFLSGCKMTEVACQEVSGIKLTLMSEVQDASRKAIACAATSQSCSVDLEVDLAVTAEQTCGDSTIGVVLGNQFPAGWTIEPMLTLSQPPAGTCVPDGGRFAADPSTNVCDGTSGNAIPTTPIFSDKQFSFSAMGPAIMVSGCKPQPNTSYKLIMSRRFIYGESLDEEDDSAADHTAAPVGADTSSSSSSSSASSTVAGNSGNDEGDAAGGHADDDGASAKFVGATAAAALVTAALLH